MQLLITGTSLTDGFVIEEEKGPVLTVVKLRHAHRPSRRGSEQIELKDRLLQAGPVSKKIGRVQRRVSQELVSLAMKLVGSRFDIDIDDGARRAAVLGVKCVGLDLELLGR